MSDQYAVFSSDFSFKEENSTELDEVLNKSALSSYLEGLSMWNKDFIFSTFKNYEKVKSEAVAILGDLGSQDNFTVNDTDDIPNIKFPSSHLGEIIQSIKDQVFPLDSKPLPPNIPRYPVTIAIFGKPFAGCSTIAQKIANDHKLVVLNIEQLLKDAISLATATANNKRRRSSVGGLGTISNQVMKSRSPNLVFT